MRKWNPELLEQLLKVQDIDLKIRSVENTIKDFYRRSKEEDPLLAQLKQDLSRIDESLTATEAQHEMYLGTLEDIRTAIKGLATTKSGAPKPRTRSSTEALRIEEEKLSAMVVETDEQTRELNEERDGILKRIDVRSGEVEKIQQGPEAEIRKLRNRIRRLERQREDEVKGTPTMLLRKYDRLKSSRSGVGLTILRDGVCTVCRMQMPTAIVSRLSLGDQILACPACGRMVARVEFIKMPVVPSAEEKAAAEKAAKKELAKKKTEAKKAPAKKAASKKAAKKEPTKKDTTEKAPAKKAPAKKAPAKKAPAKKAPAKKAPAKKAPAKKAPAKKAPAKKAPAKKAPAKKTPAKKAPAKKTSAKKAPTKKKSGKK